jgi:uncharacterized SAM-binding protein YcdF (DUF218 family)
VFFVLSKILDILLTPLAWGLGLIVVGLAVRRGGRRSPRFVPWLGVVVLVFFSLEPVSNRLWRALESPARKTFHADASYDVVILLGGVTDDRVEATWGERAYNHNNERLLETFDLLRAGNAKYAIISGGSTSDVPGDRVEARVLRDQLVSWGIDPGRIIVEDKARNTHENAVLSGAILRAKGWQKVLIVTSAFHMARAYGCFEAEGIAVDTLPVDFRSYASGYPAEILPRAEYLEQSTAVLREWAGRGIYKLRGFSK